MEYIGFAGTIPEDEYGAGEVKILNDRTFVPHARDKDRIEVVLHGRDPAGDYNLVHFRQGKRERENHREEPGRLRGLIFYH
jgi:hypothetical protein